jgi:hypothetical protein
MSFLTGIKNLTKSFLGFTVKHSPEILTGVTVIGVGVSVGTAVVATPKAMMLIDQKKKELGKDKLTKREIIAACWKVYLVPAGLTIGTMTAAVLSNRLSAKQKAEIAAVLAMYQDTLKEYQKKVVAEVGPEKEKEIREKMLDDEKPVREYVPENILFRFNGQYFYATWNFVKDVQTSIAYDLTSGLEMCISLNDILDRLGLKPDDIHGECDGINIDDRCEFRAKGESITDDGRPYVELELFPPPHQHYDVYS